MVISSTGSMILISPLHPPPPQLIYLDLKTWKDLFGKTIAQIIKVRCFLKEGLREKEGDKFNNPIYRA